MLTRLIIALPAMMLVTFSFGVAADQGAGGTRRANDISAAGRPVAVHFPASINSNGRIDDAFR